MVIVIIYFFKHYFFTNFAFEILWKLVGAMCSSTVTEVFCSVLQYVRWRGLSYMSLCCDYVINMPDAVN